MIVLKIIQKEEITMCEGKLGAGHSFERPAPVNDRRLFNYFISVPPHSTTVKPFLSNVSNS